MFSWICQRCGRDNPPSAVKCLACGARFDEDPVVEEAAVPEAIAPEYEPEPEYVPEPIPVAPPPPPARPVAGARPAPARPAPLRAQPVATPVYQQAAPARSGLPTWILTILCFFAIVGIGAGLYYGITYFQNRKAFPSAGVDPAANVARTKVTSPLQKYVEVVGIRLMQDSKKKPTARFLVVNHSPNALDDLTATVTLWASTSRSEEDSVGSFNFKVPSLGAFESKEMTAPLNTKLKFYELPDWQNATPEIEITSP